MRYLHVCCNSKIRFWIIFFFKYARLVYSNMQTDLACVEWHLQIHCPGIWFVEYVYTISLIAIFFFVLLFFRFSLRLFGVRCSDARCASHFHYIKYVYMEPYWDEGATRCENCTEFIVPFSAHTMPFIPAFISLIVTIESTNLRWRTENFKLNIIWMEEVTEKINKIINNQNK